jgi:hypothetical protein
MLFIIGLLLFGIWIATLALKVTTGLIHLLLVAAIILWIVGFARGRFGRTTTAP